ncbi:MAG: neutral/alkaline non-lysosomal ceramidase N-terminal domain-containing protein [Armatimonadetes bacterium]|nr:neutral/alkaline non-lysosomal ceramidase N-terminal domain-containing protein [Armatimonadota bacterium]
MAAPLQVGVARATITPPVGIQLVGFAGRGPALGLHDDLYATALVASSGDARAALITCDLLGLDADRVAEVRAEVARRTDIPAAHVMVSCSHTHYGPSVGMPHHGEPEADVAAYIRVLPHLLAGAVQQAAAKLQEARIGVGRGSSDIGINRRERLSDGTIKLGHNPDGPIDREVGVIRFDGADGRPLATLANFACHPVSQGGSVRLISADYPGRTRAVVEQLTEAPCLFLQGAGANINTRRMEPDNEPARQQGTILACDVVRTRERVSSAPAAGVAVASETLALPAMTFASEAEGREQVAALERQSADQRARGADPGAIQWTERRLERARRQLDSLCSGDPLPSIAAEVQALRLGPVVLAGAPGEIFNEIGRAVKERSPAPETFFLGYTNGSIGYVPVPEAYPEGGYEVTHACRVDPPAAGMIIEGCLRMVGRVVGRAE